jgi:hypothetical protein
MWYDDMWDEHILISTVTTYEALGPDGHWYNDLVDVGFWVCPGLKHWGMSIVLNCLFKWQTLSFRIGLYPPRNNVHSEDVLNRDGGRAKTKRSPQCRILSTDRQEILLL